MAAIELDASIEALMQPQPVLGVSDLLRVLLHRPEWQQDAACLGHDPGRFFPGQGGDLEPARAVCRSCPVRVDCLEYAMEADVQGVWAGTGRQQRRRACARGTTAAQLLAELAP